MSADPLLFQFFSGEIHTGIDNEIRDEILSLGHLAERNADTHSRRGG